jgi:hypothetical protein
MRLGLILDEEKTYLWHIYIYRSSNSLFLASRFFRKAPKQILEPASLARFSARLFA